MSIDSVKQVVINFADPILLAGATGHMLVRLSQDDRETVQMAASVLGLTQAEFARTVLVRCAERVIRENAK